MVFLRPVSSRSRSTSGPIDALTLLDAPVCLPDGACCTGCTSRRLRARELLLQRSKSDFMRSQTRSCRQVFLYSPLAAGKPLGIIATGLGLGDGTSAVMPGSESMRCHDQCVQ